ncbi:rhomboid family intramembrane serine protease [Campylobacter sp. RM16190]|uniref:rhomboid family intramembrane serine protease n=1 Tax=Campylobacter sp. RM16190 TaxID=1705727 RepID=UPI0014754D57|nr:rhomboid family intramembrane serine protease [Campylobacter sp. RM16190]
MYVTSFLIAFNCLVYFLINFIIQDSDLNLVFGLNLLLLDQNFFWQLLSSMFMHGNLTHLLMNMAVLFQFGSILERELGALKFSLVYLLGGITTSLLSFVYIYFVYEFNGNFINLVGASGAISVLLGIMAFLDRSSAKGLLIAILLMSFVPLMMGVNIAWYAHIIGFGVGYLIMKARVL